MQSLNPLDDRLIRRIQNQDTEIRNSGFTTQNYIGDQYSLTPSLYSFHTTNVLQTSASEINRWQKGDRAFIRQSSTDKTFFVSEVDRSNNRIRLSAGSTFSYTNNAIESIKIAPVRIVPLGFPSSYQFAPALAVSTGTISSITLVRREFALQGDVCTVWITANFTVGGGGSSDVLITVPIQGFNLGGTGSTNLGGILTVGSSFAPSFGFVASLSGSDYTQVAVQSTTDFFDGANQTISGQFSYKIL